MHNKQRYEEMENEVSQKEKLEVEINYLVTLLYGLSQSLNDKEKSIEEHTDPELISIYKADSKALIDDCIKIADQIKIRLGMYMEEASKNNDPVDIDYFRLYKTLAAFLDV